MTFPSNFGLFMKFFWRKYSARLPRFSCETRTPRLFVSRSKSSINRFWVYNFEQGTNSALEKSSFCKILTTFLVNLISYSSRALPTTHSCLNCSANKFEKREAPGTTRQICLWVYSIAHCCISWTELSEKIDEHILHTSQSSTNKSWSENIHHANAMNDRNVFL